MTATHITPASSFTPATTGLSAQQLAQTKAAAKEFEAVFVSEMMSHMFEGIETDPVFGGGGGEDMFRSMLIQEYGKQMSKGPGIGISDQLQKQMIEMQQHIRG